MPPRHRNPDPCFLKAPLRHSEGIHGAREDAKRAWARSSGDLSRGYGAESSRIQTLDGLASAYRAALAFEGVTVLVVPITGKLKALIG